MKISSRNKVAIDSRFLTVESAVMIFQKHYLVDHTVVAPFYGGRLDFVEVEALSSDCSCLCAIRINYCSCSVFIITVYMPCVGGSDGIDQFSCVVVEIEHL